MEGNRRARTADRQTEERLARLLRPGPRHVRLDDNSTDRSGNRAGNWADDWPDDRPDDRPDDWGDDRADDGKIDSTAGEPDTRSAPGERSGGLLRGRLSGRFERPQLVVIAVIVVIGLLLSGWAVLRARPVAIAAPGSPSPGRQADDTGPVRPVPSVPRQSGQPARDGPSAGSSAGSGAGSSAGSSAGPSTPTAMITVHVLGAVRRPGVVELPVDSRVQDALDAARGVRERAELGDLNLAQRLADGQQVFIAGRVGESEVRDPGSAPGSAGAGAGGSGTDRGASGSSGGPDAPVDLNTATSEDLDQLPGVGPVTAQKILSWREEHGSFSSVDELQEIDGIGPKTFAELAPLVTV